MSNLTASNMKLVRYALRANAAFSAASAVGFLVAATPLAGMIAIGAEDFRFLGVNLAVFSVLLVLFSSDWAIERRWLPALVLVIAFLDAGWVVGSVPLAMLPSTTAGGRLFIIITSTVVGIFAIVQFYAVMRNYRDRRAQQKAYR